MYTTLKDEAYIDIEIASGSSVVQIDTEGAVVESVFIGEESGEMISKDGWVCVIWSTEDNTFTVEGTLSQAEILSIARNLKEK